MSTAVKQKKDLTEGKLLPKIILFALPLIATSVLHLLFNTADSIVVGNWGGATPEEREIALGAVGSCGALITLIVNLFMGLSVGAGVCVAHDIGAKRYDEVEKTVHTSVLTALICSVFVTAIGIIFAEDLLVLMGINESFIPQATLYMRAYFCGMPANLLYNYCASMLRSAGDSTRPLIFLTAGGVINVLLNLVLVCGFHVPGALGVGVATAASQWVSCVFIIVFMLKTSGPCKLIPRKLRIVREKLQKIIAIGLPAGFQGALFSVSNVIIQSAIHSFGIEAVVAGNTAASNLDSYTYSVMNSFATSALTFTGQHVGARKFGRLKKVVLWHMLLAVVSGLLVSSFMFVLRAPLLSLFVSTKEAMDVATIRLAVIGLPYFLCGLMDVGCYTLRGFGKSLVPTVGSLVGACLSRIVWIYAVFYPFFSDQPAMLFLSYPLTWSLTAATFYIFIIIEFKKYKSESLQKID